MFVFHVIMVATLEVLVLDKFLNSSFVISSQKKATASYFYSSQHVENGKEKNYLISVHSFRNHIETS